LSESCLKKWRRTEVSIPYTGSADAVGRHTTTFQIELRSARVPEAPSFYNMTGLDGTPPKRFVVIAFDSDLRKKSTKSRVLAELRACPINLSNNHQEEINDPILRARSYGGPCRFHQHQC
jgi:hypothetical protein